MSKTPPLPPGLSVVDIPGVRVRKDTHLHEFQLTDEEFVLRAEDLAMQHVRIGVHDDYSARVRKLLKTQADELSAERARLANVVSKRAEPRKVSVDVFIDRDRGRVYFVMGLTDEDGRLRGTILATEPATEKDLAAEAKARQGNLFPLHAVPSDGDAGPTLPRVTDDDDGDDLEATNGVREIWLHRFNGAPNQKIRAVAALRNAFRSMPLVEAKAHIDAVDGGEHRFVGRLSGNALHSGLDQLRCADLEVEAIEPVKVEDAPKTPDELFPHLDEVSGADLDAAVLGVLPDLERSSHETDTGYRARARRAGALRGFLAPAGTVLRPGPAPRPSDAASGPDDLPWGGPDASGEGGPPAPDVLAGAPFLEGAVKGLILSRGLPMFFGWCTKAGDGDGVARFRVEGGRTFVVAYRNVASGVELTDLRELDAGGDAAGVVVLDDIAQGRKEAVEEVLRQLGWSRDGARGLMKRATEEGAPDGWVAYRRGEIAGLPDMGDDQRRQPGRAPKGEKPLDEVAELLREAGATVRTIPEPTSASAP